MNKKPTVIAIITIFVIFLTSCSNTDANEQTGKSAQVASVTQTNTLTETAKEPALMQLIIDGKKFDVIPKENETADAFAALLPVTFNMKELNGNEKYYYLDSPLPSSPQSTGKIHKGDIMLYGDNCIVVFYKDFGTQYSYTPIGHINNTEALEKTLGNGDVNILFK